MRWREPIPISCVKWLSIPIFVGANRTKRVVYIARCKIVLHSTHSGTCHAEKSYLPFGIASIADPPAGGNRQTGGNNRRATWNLLICVIFSLTLHD
jgi:hypothetical protein